MKKQFILVAIFSFIIFGFGFTNSAQALSDPIPGIDIVVKPNQGGIAITSSDLGVDNVGTLPNSRFYFLKQWGRGIERLFTFNPVAKAELELTITNQIAAEMLTVEKANPDDTSAIKKALENYTNSQERLNMRIGKLPATTNPNVEKLLKNIDEKTAKQASLIEQLTEQHSGQLKFEVVDDSLKNARDNILKTFTVAVTPVNDEPAMKQKAEDQIKSAEVAISEANSALQQVSTTRGINVNPGGVDVRGSDKQSIFDRWGNLIAKAKSNLDSAKKAFAEGKYGEAYGQARSAEAMVPILATGSNFPDKKVDIIAPTTPSTETETKIDTNQKPTEQKDEPRTTPTSIELKSSTTIKGSAGSTSTTIKN